MADVLNIHAVDPVLTNMLVAYENQDMAFIASKVFPQVSVPSSTGTFYSFTKKYWFLNQMQVRARGQQYARATIGVGTDTYVTAQFALAYAIADETRRDSQLPMDLETAAVRFLGRQSLIQKELKFSADMMVYTSWTSSDNNSATDWDDFTSGDPVSNILTAKSTVIKLTGQEPNTMALGRVVHDALINHPDILDRIKYVQAATMDNTNSALKALFGVSNYFVSNAAYTNTNEAASYSGTSIIDDDCLVCYVTPNPGVFEASAGYTFAWDGGGGMGTILRSRDDENDTDLIKLKEEWDQKIVAADLGYFFADIV